jgi:glycosyltransferase involved in cell wall biosynthesis
MPGRVPKGQYRLYRRLDCVLAVSSPVRTAVLAENPRLAPVTKILGYPVDWSALARPRPAPGPGSPVVIGFVGRLHREKGLDLLVAALGLLARQPGLPPWRAVLCGPADVAHGGSGEAYVRDLQRSLETALPAGSFEVLPPVFTDDKLAEVYRHIDVFCYPSIADRGETFGVAVAEAMATGAVPVVSQLACFNDFVRAGENGESFDQTAPGAPARLAAVLARLLVDPALRAKLAGAARAAVQRYDFPLFAERLLRDFSTLK